MDLLLFRRAELEFLFEIFGFLDFKFLRFARGGNFSTKIAKLF